MRLTHGGEGDQLARLRGTPVVETRNRLVCTASFPGEYGAPIELVRFLRLVVGDLLAAIIGYLVGAVTELE